MSGFLRSALLAILALLSACDSKPTAPTGLRLDPAVAESWVVPGRWPGHWTILADVRDLVGDDRWAAFDTAWMEEKARADLATVTAEDDYDDDFILSGLWRLGLLRAEVLATLALKEPDAPWPLVANDLKAGIGWRPRVEWWLRKLPVENRKDVLAGKLFVMWEEAVAAKDLELMARVLEVGEAWLGREKAPEAMRPDVEATVRFAMSKHLREYRNDWRWGRLPTGAIALMERFGIPEGVDIDAVVAAARHYYLEMTDAGMPLPHPYDLNVRTQRLMRLAK